MGPAEDQQDQSAEEQAGEGVASEQEEGQELLSIEELTKHVHELQVKINELISAHNANAEYVNNLQENPAFVAGILGHLNDLVEGKQVFFIHVYSTLTEEDQKQCWRAQLLYKDQQELMDIAAELGLEDPDEVPGHRKIDLALELFDHSDGEWQTIVDDDPIRETLRESITHRLVLMDAPHATPHYISVQVVDSSAMFGTDDAPGEQ